ncbi:MAG TPA: amino acid permease [Chthoniobacteraceae bacterium]|jgi:amino acid transporter/nucleotide-binding universal stress UspA family protein
MGPSLEVNRPRNLDWKRASALLYGDWGTSKAYVIGLAFVAGGFGSMPLIIAVCVLTGLVGINYAAICRYFPDGGGVYSAARSQGQTLAVIGALLLVADLTVTAALSGFEALRYLGVPTAFVPMGTIGIVALFGFLNWYGPKHSGSLAVALAIPTTVAIVILIGISIPHLTTVNFEPPHSDFAHTWIDFTGVILALSGVEAIANLTGVMKLDPGSTPDKPRVARESFRAILPVGLEVTIGTALLAWAMLSLPKNLEPQLHANHESMIRYLAEYYGGVTFGPWFGHAFGWAVGIVVALLLLSAVNTAIAALIGLLYMLARDGEMPKTFGNLNRHGVPRLPLYVSVGLPAIVLLFTIPSPTTALHMLAGLYAIGVVGAIALNLGCCALNKQIPASWFDRGLFVVTFVILAAVELTLAKTKPDALFFVVCVLGLGLGIRSWSHKRSGLKTITVSADVAAVVTPENIELLRPVCREGQRIMVAARGITPVLRFALDEARLRKATLCVLYVKELAVFLGGASQPATKRAKWQDDPHAAAIMSLMLKLGEETGVDVLPVFAVSTDPASTILDLSATLGVDFLMLGAQHRFTMAKLLKGNVVERVAAGLPEDIQLLIHG